MSRNSFSPQVKFPPLSDLIFSGESPQCVYEGICIHTLDNFKVDCSNHEAGKHEPVSFHQASIALHQEWSKTVDSNEANGRLVRSYMVCGQICFLLFTEGLLSQLKQPLNTLRIVTLALTIQNLSLRSPRTYSCPECPDLM